VTHGAAHYACAVSAIVAPICLIVNPAAGGGKARRIAPDAERMLREHGLTVRRVDTRDLEHARALALHAASASETVVALSGDGMVGAIADALRGAPGATLGVLPGGRGNDLARVLGISAELPSACATIAEGVPRAMDVGEVLSADADERGRAFVGIASAGFDSDANRIANDAPSWLGGLVYAYGALRALLSWRPARFEIELDPPGVRHAFTGFSVGVANSKSYGGGMRAAPGALLDDGLLDIVVVERMSKLRFLTQLLPRIFKGTHVDLPTVHTFRAAEVLISVDRPFTMYADGDPIGELPVRVRAVRGAVRMLVPRRSGDDPAFADAASLDAKSAARARSAGEPFDGR
jgi:YegS/Rv2252/BmrU family lipid kinase